MKLLNTKTQAIITHAKGKSKAEIVVEVLIVANNKVAVSVVMMVLQHLVESNCNQMLDEHNR